MRTQNISANRYKIQPDFKAIYCKPIAPKDTSFDAVIKSRRSNERVYQAMQILCSQINSNKNLFDGFTGRQKLMSRLPEELKVKVRDALTKKGIIDPKTNRLGVIIYNDYDLAKLTESNKKIDAVMQNRDETGKVKDEASLLAAYEDYLQTDLKIIHDAIEIKPKLLEELAYKY